MKVSYHQLAFHTESVFQFFQIKPYQWISLETELQHTEGWAFVQATEILVVWHHDQLKAEYSLWCHIFQQDLLYDNRTYLQ